MKKREGLFIILGLLLMVSFTFVKADSSAGSTSTYFSTSSAACVSDSITSYWQSYTDSTNVEWVYNITNTTLQNTVGLCNDSSSGAWCCPSGFVCSQGLCKELNVSSPGCVDFHDASACNSSDSSIAITDLSAFSGGTFDYVGLCNNVDGQQWMDSNNVLCGNFTNCGCSWDTVSNSCTDSGETTTFCADGTVTSSNCAWVQDPNKEDNCNDPNKKDIVIDYNSSWGGAPGSKPSWCVDQQQVFPCTVSVKLPFFSAYQFWLSALAITGIYFISRKR